MRVVAGTARGVALQAPPGRETRPISDRVKETLFAILGARVVDARLLDLYAGSGAVGIEALSRGALAVTFVERQAAACATIRANLSWTGLGAGAIVRQAAVVSFLAARVSAPFDLVVLDPPYAERAILAPLERLAPHLAPAALVVVKHFWRTEVPAVNGLETWRVRRFGETSLTFLRR